jgi:hypothetical protein
MALCRHGVAVCVCTCLPPCVCACVCVLEGCGTVTLISVCCFAQCVLEGCGMLLRRVCATEAITVVEHGLAQCVLLKLLLLWNMAWHSVLLKLPLLWNTAWHSVCY